MQVQELDKYGVKVHKQEDDEWEVVEIRHLSPEENKGKHNVYVDAFGLAGVRAVGARLLFTWDGNREGWQSISLDKPDGEPMGNIPLWRGQVGSVRMAGRSNVVTGLHTLHPDELGPNGEKWNSMGHHSFYICFQKVVADKRDTLVSHWWLAELDQYDNPKLVDGAHSDRSGVDRAMQIIRGLPSFDDNKRYAVAHIEFSEVG